MEYLHPQLKDSESESESDSELNMDMDTDKESVSTRWSDDILYEMKPQIVRYNDKIYWLREHYMSVYFHEYFLWKLKPDEYTYEFFLCHSQLEYNDLKNKDPAYMKSMYNKVRREMKQINEKDVHTTLIDCLRCQYITGTTYIISPLEVAEREAIHKSNFQKELNGLFEKVTKMVYEWPKKGYTGGTMQYRCIESRLTDFGKYPIFYEVSNADGRMRPTYPEYLYYIAFQVFPAHVRKNAEEDKHEQVSEKEWMGEALCKLFKTVYANLKISWSLDDNEVFPTVHFDLSFPTGGVLT